jgi:ABC-2 type transport system permease protein
LKLGSDIYYVFWREMKRFWLQKTRVVMTIFQPLIWFALMGSTMNNLTQGMTAGSLVNRMMDGGTGSLLIKNFLDGAPDYMTYVAGGIIAMTALSGGIFGGTTVVWDRRLGFLNKMLAAPINRASIPLGKMLAVAVQNTIQVAVIIIIAMIFGVNFSTGLAGILLILFIAALFSMGMAGISLALGARLKSIEALFAIVNMLFMPLIFSSPAMFPASAMPGWLLAFSHWNPVTYAVMPLRALIYKGWLGKDILFGASVVIGFVLLTGALAIFQFKRSIS